MTTYDPDNLCIPKNLDIESAIPLTVKRSLLAYFIPVGYIIVQIFVLIDSYNLISDLGTPDSGETIFQINSFFWHYELFWYEEIQPKVTTYLFWVSGCILSALSLWYVTKTDQNEADETEVYQKILLRQLILVLIFLELVTYSYANLVYVYLPRTTFVGVILELHIYFVMPMLVLWFSVSELTRPRIKLSQDQSLFVLTIVILLVLYTTLFTFLVGFED